MTIRADSPYGFYPNQRVIQANWYSLNCASFSTYKNDMVRMTAGGQVALANGGRRVPLLGACQSFIDSDGVPLAYAASGSTGVHVMVTDSPEQTYHAQEDHNATALHMLDRGNIGCLIRTHHGLNGNGVARSEIDSSTFAAATSGQFFLIQEYSDDDQMSALGFKRWIVRISRHDTNVNVGRGPIGI